MKKIMEGFSKKINIKQLIVGSALLILASIWNVFFAPQLGKISPTFNYSAEVVSTDNFYDKNLKAFTGPQLSKTIFYYETVELTNDTALIKNVFDVRTIDDQPIFITEKLYAIDRKTGEHVAHQQVKDREGYLFAPKNLQQGQNYTYWHVNYDNPAHMEFVKEEQLYGMRVFQYQTNFEGQHIDQTKELTGILPGVGDIYGIKLDVFLQTWIEPKSGTLVKYKDNSTAFFYDLKTGEIISPWNNFSNTYSEEAAIQKAGEAKQARSFAATIDDYIDTLLILFGILLLINALVVASKKDVENNRALEILFGTAIITLSIYAEYSWITNNIYLLSTDATINPLTAICFLLLGLSILLLHTSVRSVVSISALLISISLTNVVTKFELLSFVTLPKLDQLLFAHTVLETGSTMSLFTSIAFTILGLATIAFGLNKAQKVPLTLFLSMTIIHLSIAVVIGHIFPAINISSLFLFEHTSMFTAFLFILSSSMLILLFNRYPKNQLHFAANKSILILLLICVLLSVFFTAVVNNRFTSQAFGTFRLTIQQIEEEIENRFNIYINTIQGTLGLLSASDNVSREEWKKYIETIRVTEKFPGIQALGYSTIIQPEDLENHIQEIQEQGFSEYAVYPESQRNIYTSVIYIEPFDTRNQEALGFDMFQDPIRGAAITQARDTGLPRLSGQVTLVQEIDENVQAGFLIYIPYYGNSNPITAEERRQSIVGYPFAAFRAHDFFSGILNQINPENVAIEVYDGISIEKKSLVFSNTNSDYLNPKYEFIQTVFIAGRPWTIKFVSTPFYGETPYTKAILQIVPGIGIVVTLLVALIAYTLATSRKTAITYAEKVTRDIREGKARTEAILDSIGEALIAMDTKGNIIIVNNAFEKITGMKQVEVVGKKLITVLPIYNEHKQKIPDTKRPITKVIQESKDKIYRSQKHYYQTKDGELFPVSLTLAPVIDKDKIIGIVQVFRDISQEKEIDKAKSEFVSLASHQLRTPLSLINWYTEMLLDDQKKITKQQREYLSEIYNGSQRMVALVNSLLNVSRLELGTFTIEPELLDIRPVVKSIVNELQPMIKTKKIKVTTKIRRDVPKINVDPKLFRIIIQNLMSNAVKYTPTEGKVTIIIEKVEQHIHIAVSDTGIGIPESQQSKIFTKLFRADNARNSDTDGTGLGLYIIKTILEHSKGSISFDSKENKGTTFHVKLPIKGMQKKKGSRAIE